MMLRNLQKCVLVHVTVLDGVLFGEYLILPILPKELRKMLIIEYEMQGFYIFHLSLWSYVPWSCDLVLRYVHSASPT